MSISDPTAQQLFAKVDDIANGIAQSEAAAMYWQARDKMMHHQEAQGLFDDLKKKTNGLLVLKDRLGEQSEKYQRIKEEAERIEARLAEIPVALQYKAAQDELNAMLQEVMLVLLANLKAEVPVEPGPRSCGSGGSCSTGGGCSCSAH
ncbi:YlbF family regulator [Alicyclobacillus fastidiosus]|uniref:YlbF family regulator n=1 Tax=Alicyclobacillus fastidiosus TaxID=392011 RepID=A0ABV5AHJ5_9BACL|nr:YlbF family regulator [Alicyclobacillus fastidiosus]WEH07846.1 YlbF family regulator [Alicyclobacillus fastidiosus]